MDSHYDDGNGLIKKARNISVEIITHAVAAEYLKTMVNNRPINKRHVDYLTRQMKDGNWDFTAEPIKFDWNGRLIDGQHRLLAIIKSGVSIEALVARGLDPDSFSKLDQGKPRSAGNVLAMRGEKNVNLLAACTTAMWRHNNGYPFYDSGAPYPSFAEIDETLSENPDIRTGIVEVAHIPHIARPSTASFLWVQFSRKDRDLTDWFFECLKYGGPRRTGVNVLRDQLLSNQKAKSRLLLIEVAAKMVRAWNVHRLLGRDAKVGALKGMVEGGPFPDIK